MFHTGDRVLIITTKKSGTIGRAERYIDKDKHIWWFVDLDESGKLYLAREEWLQWL